MTLRSKYTWYLFAFSLLCSLSLKAQYSEQDLKNEADKHFRNRAYVEAMPLYSQLLSLNPTNPTYNYKYGASALYGSADNKKESIKFLRFASRASGVDKEVWYFLGRAYHLNYFFSDAIEAYGKFRELASSKEIQELEIDRRIQACRDGLGLLSQIKEITVLDKKSASVDAFFRLYDLTDIGGRILVTPDALLSNLDKKNNHRSLIHFRGSGTTVYFSSYGRDGKNGLDIYRADVLPNGEFSEPVALPSTINSPYDEDFPYMHPDGKTLYFSSKGHGSMGGYDIFRSTLDPGTGIFSPPQNLDFAVNTPDDDLFYVVDSLNHLANFSSSRSSPFGSMHVYRVEVETAPMELTFVKGDFINHINPEVKTTKIIVTDVATGRELDVQFSDPNTGEYLLNFPHGGRYKLSVEVSGSDRVHVGIVDIPLSTGVNAYLQEMELTSSGGIEKLSINNRFDKTFDGDIAALAQELLRQKAQLDVNFNRTESTTESAPIADAGSNPDRAYNDAGFGAGMSNELIIQQAEEREVLLENRIAQLDELTDKAAEKSANRLQDARDLLARADELTRRARAGESGDPHADMFNAGVARHRANIALKESRNAEALMGLLEARKAEVDGQLTERKSRTENLRTSVASGDYDTVLEAMKEERAYRENLDPNADRFEPVRTLREESLEAANLARSAMERASSMRATTNKQTEALQNAKRRREIAKGAEIARLDEEIERLTDEVQSAQRRTENAFAQAEELMRVADDEHIRYEMLAEFTQTENAAVTSEDNPVWTQTAQEEIEVGLDEVDIDDAMVAAYMEANPDAATDEFGDAMALEFRKYYAGVEATPTKTHTAQTPEESVETTDEVAVAEPTAQEAGNQVVEAEPPVVVETTEPAIDTAQDASEPAIVDVPEDELAARDEAADEAGEEVVFVGETDLDETGQEEENHVESQSSENEADAVEAPQEDVDDPTQPAVDAGDVPEDSTYDDPSIGMEEKIRLEREKVAAAKDWVAIIEESEAELQSGGEGDTEQVREQLRQYAALKSDRLREIEEGEERIAQWERELEYAHAQRLQTAFEDVDTLDASLVARLEMKIPEIAEDVRVMRDLREIDRDYLAELAAVELSGLSHPEIARQRIRLAESLIEDLDGWMEDDAQNEIPRERLLELRRILALGIRQDQEVLEGALAYRPRTPEAREYAELIHGEDEIAENDDAVQMRASGELSPDMEADLALPFSRSVVYPDYEEEQARIGAITDSLARTEERMKLNRLLLDELAADIDLYKLGVESTDEPDERLLARYQDLLSERFEVVTELQRDAAALNAASSNAPADVAALTENSEGTANDEDEMAEAPSLSADLSAAGPETRPVHHLKAEYRERVDDIESRGLEPDVRLDSLTALSLRTADVIDREVERLVDMLDDPTLKVNRDSLQILINDLDAVAADQRQLADLYRNEKESLELASALEDRSDTASEQQEEPEVAMVEAQEDVEMEGTEEIDADDLQEALMEVEVADGIDLGTIHYRSLNANIRRGELEERVETAEELSGEIEAQRLQLETAEGPERDSLVIVLANNNRKLQAINEDILKGLVASNAEERAYYESENRRLLEDLSSAQPQEAIVVGDESLTVESIGERLAESENTSALDVEALTAEQRKNLLAKELQRIEELSALNEQLREKSAELHEMRRREALAMNVSGSEGTLATVGHPSIWAMVNDSTTYEPLPEKAYLNPIHVAVGEELTVERRTELIAEEPALDIDLEFADEGNEEASKALLMTKSHVDETGIALLSETPLQYAYITSSIRADSLKALEWQTADLSEDWLRMARENASEVERLERSLPSVTVEAERKETERRIADLRSETEELLQKSAIAASRAELLREERRRSEEELALAALELTHSQRKALDDLKGGRSYAVVSQDESEHLARNANEWIVGGAPEVPTAPVVTASQPLAVSPTTTEVVANTAPSSQEVTVVAEVPPADNSVPETTSPTEAEGEAYEEVLPAANATDFIPKDLYEQTGGNWLGIVDIIAEKDDFSDVTETMFVATGRDQVYSNENPIPMDPEMPEGLIFQVQVGAYRNAIPQDLFGEFAPIMGMDLGDGITRYRAGLFKLYAQAAAARDKIREKGYSDAFVVAFLDGQRLTEPEARELLAQASREEANTAAPGNSIAPVAESTPPSNASENAPPDYYNDPEAAEAIQVEATPGLFFTVQVGVYSKPVKLEQLYNLDNLNTELTSGGLIRYTTGRYPSIEAATPKKLEAREKGVADAFITAYLNGARIPIDSAMAVLENEGPSILSENLVGARPEAQPAPTVDEASGGPSDEGGFIVIMGRFTTDVPQELANLFLERPELNIRRIEGPGGGAIYVTSELPSRQDALQILEISRRAGVTTAVIGRIVDGEIKEIISD